MSGVKLSELDGWDLIEGYRFYTSFPLGRWLMNRQRRREGKPPFPFWKAPQ